MTIKDYLIQLKTTQQGLIKKEEYEMCAHIQEVINSIEKKDRTLFIDLHFDKKTLKEIGFLKKRATYSEIEQRIITYFGYDNMYQYVCREGMWCPYVRYFHGIHDIIKKVEF
jgi:hypothetical protein